jgi:ABC-2 type transport system ATP-binding protein
VLKIIDVHKRFGHKVVLDTVSLSAEPSDIVVLTGENGSGKSTLLRIVCGILEPTRGHVEICGHSIERAPERAKAVLGYVPDGMETLPDLLASEFIALVRALKPGRASPHAPLEEEWKERLGVGSFWDQRVSALSFGQRKRLAMLAALSGDPRLLLLDEPTNGLDPQGVELVQELLKRRSKTGDATLLSTNDPNFASTLHAKHYRLGDGKLIATSRAG